MLPRPHITHHPYTPKQTSAYHTHNLLFLFTRQQHINTPYFWVSSHHTESGILSAAPGEQHRASPLYLINTLYPYTPQQHTDSCTPRAIITDPRTLALFRQLVSQYTDPH